MRDDVTLHPQCDAFGVQQVVSADSVPSDGSTVHLSDPSSEAEFRRALTNLDADVDCVVLSNGVDADGAVHESEFVVFRRLGDEQQECASVHPLVYHFRRWVGAWRRDPSVPSSPTPPMWLAEAESLALEVPPCTTAPPPSPTTSESHPAPISSPAACETAASQSSSHPLRTPQSAAAASPVEVSPLSTPVEVGPPSPSVAPALEVVPSPRSPLATPPSAPAVSNTRETRVPDGTPSWLVEAEVQVDETSRADETTFAHASTGRVLLTLTGVLPPSVLASLAQTNSIVHLPAQDGGTALLTRVRGAIWLGACVVDTATWSPTSRKYRVTPREKSSQIAPRRTVAQIHRLKRRQFERR